LPASSVERNPPYFIGPHARRPDCAKVRRFDSHTGAALNRVSRRSVQDRRIASLRQSRFGDDRPAHTHRRAARNHAYHAEIRLTTPAAGWINCLIETRHLILVEMDEILFPILFTAADLVIERQLNKKIELLGLTADELYEFIAQFGEKPFRARQLYD